MASFDMSATTGGARKHAWTKILPLSLQNLFVSLEVIGGDGGGGGGGGRAVKFLHKGSLFAPCLLNSFLLSSFYSNIGQYST